MTDSSRMYARARRLYFCHNEITFIKIAYSILCCRLQSHVYSIFPKGVYLSTLPSNKIESHFIL